MFPITIKVNENAPHPIQGDDTASPAIVGHRGNAAAPAGPAIELYCGAASVSRGFCNGTHRRIGFTGAGEARREYDAKKGGE